MDGGGAILKDSSSLVDQFDLYEWTQIMRPWTCTTDVSNAGDSWLEESLRFSQCSKSFIVTSGL